jgi:PST family polysaccharide transporter
MKLAVNEQGSLFARAGKALGFSFASTALSRVSTFAFGIALARILGPKEFGTYAVAMVALLAVLSFNELGVSLAVVRWPGEPEEIIPTIATISVVSSAVIYIGCYLGAPAFSQAMGSPGATPVVRLLALGVLIDGFLSAPVGLLQRRFRQDRKLIADLITSWISAGVSIGCAISGMGAMSLAVGLLAGSVAGAVMFIWFAPEGIRFGFDRSKARALLRFGLPLAGSSIVVFAVQNVDKLIVGAVFGPVKLGFYVLATNLSNIPVQTFSQPVRAVAPAAMARLQSDPPAMRTTFLSTAGLLSAVTLPVCVLLAAAADPLVHFMYGPSWGPAASVLRWLGLLGALRIMFELVYDYFVVLANTRVVFTVQVIWLVALVPALYLGSHLAGPPGAGAAQFLVALCIVLPIYLFEMRRTGISVGAFASRIAVPLAAAVGVAAVGVLASRAIPNDIVSLLVSGIVALAAMVLLVYRLRTVLRSLRNVDVPEPVGQDPIPALFPEIPSQRPSDDPDVTVQFARLRDPDMTVQMLLRQDANATVQFAAIPDRWPL